MSSIFNQVQDDGVFVDIEIVLCEKEAPVWVVVAKEVDQILHEAIEPMKISPSFCELFMERDWILIISRYGHNQIGSGSPFL